MTIKELKELIKHLPDNMEIAIANEYSNQHNGPIYNVYGRTSLKARVKLTKYVNGAMMIQSRPVKDDDILANLALIIE